MAASRRHEEIEIERAVAESYGIQAMYELSIVYRNENVISEAVFVDYCEELFKIANLCKVKNWIEAGKSYHSQKSELGTLLNASEDFLYGETLCDIMKLQGKVEEFYLGLAANVRSQVDTLELRKKQETAKLAAQKQLETIELAVQKQRLEWQQKNMSLLVYQRAQITGEDVLEAKLVRTAFRMKKYALATSCNDEEDFSTSSVAAMLRQLYIDASKKNLKTLREDNSVHTSSDEEENMCSSSVVVDLSSSENNMEIENVQQLEQDKRRIGFFNEHKSSPVTQALVQPMVSIVDDELLALALQFNSQTPTLNR